MIACPEDNFPNEPTDPARRTSAFASAKARGKPPQREGDARQERERREELVAPVEGHAGDAEAEEKVTEAMAAIARLVKS